ncbi:hypothetical protein ACFOWZ_43665 [Lentzea rhizosphaerae]|uniref:Major Facilitator Superfamily protein n=1 Tax=Lentzea rhizosphaerae TaxID=2041025 RepID=A0ABV8C8G8_9PSEU
MSQAVARNWGSTRTWAVVAVAGAAQTLLWLDNSILDIAVETLADPVRGLGANAGELAWASSSYSLVLAAAVFAGGVLGDRCEGVISAPITTAMMAVLPPQTSSAGAAINSAIRRVGGALGTAALGSLLAANHHRHIAPSLSRLPQAATREPWLVDAANHTFLQARYTSSIWATLLSLIGVAFVLRCFRSDR